MKSNKTLQFETRAIVKGEEPLFEYTGDVVSPIHLSSTYARKKIDIPTKGHEYSRSDNPTRQALEKRLASLEGVDYAFAFASGLSAETTILLSLLKSGDHIIAFNDLYGGTKRLFEQVIQQFTNIEISYVDAQNVDAVQSSIQSNTKLIWLECPTNPLLKICDIRAITNIAKMHNIITLIDNTFLSSYFLQAISLGADIVLHSATKYLNGHSDMVGGCIMTDQVILAEKIQFMQNAIGAILSPFDSYLLLRGTKTLALRMEQHQKNALAIALYLEAHPKINRVIYPGLKSYPQHTLAKKQFTGFGGMLSFELKTDLVHTKHFTESLEIFHIAESLGGIESLVEIPSLMTHSAIPKLKREAIGIHDTLIRLSVGIEHIEDLIEDLSQALTIV